MTTFRKTVVYIRLPLYSLFHPRGIIRFLLDEQAVYSGPYTAGVQGGQLRPHLKNYIFDFNNVIINYNLDIWDFFPPPPPGEKSCVRPCVCWYYMRQKNYTIHSISMISSTLWHFSFVPLYSCINKTVVCKISENLNWRCFRVS